MDPLAQFVGQNLVDHSVTLHPARSIEGGGHNRHPEMGFPFRPGSHMTGVKVGFVDNL